MEIETSSQKQKTINNRIYSRNIPSQPLQPYLDARPVMTKYSIMPIVDPRQQINTPLVQTSTYNPNYVFNPGNDLGPWAGFANNVNVETELRSQIYALQKCSQSVYIPNSNSNLYNVQWNNNNLDNSTNQPFPHLFNDTHFSPFNPNPEPNRIGYALFNNATRQQLKDLTN
jgi:hypothetical protein